MDYQKPKIETLKASDIIEMLPEAFQSHQHPI